MKKPIFAAGMQKLSPLQRIIIKTGRRPIECKCRLCKTQCRTPCLATPHDILRLMDAGYIDRLKPTLWYAGIMMGLTEHPVPLIQAECVEDKVRGSHCIFFTTEGLCELHLLGLKPTEGRLSHHTTRIDNWKPSKSIGWAVVQEWLMPENADVVSEVVRRLDEYQKEVKQSNQ